VIINGLILTRTAANSWFVNDSGPLGNQDATFTLNANQATLVLSAVPEPSTYLLFAIGMIVIIAVARRKRRQG